MAGTTVRKRITALFRICKLLPLVYSQLTDLLKAVEKKAVSFNPDAQRAFKRLKDAFTSAPILKLPDPEKPFVVEVDASEVGIGAVLSQRHSQPKKLYLCVFFSRKSSSVERNYDIGNHELLAVKAALKE